MAMLKKGKKMMTMIMDDYYDDDGFVDEKYLWCTSSSGNSAINKFWNIKSRLPPPHISTQLLWIHISFLFHYSSEIPQIPFLNCKNAKRKGQNANKWSCIMLQCCMCFCRSMSCTFKDKRLHNKQICSPAIFGPRMYLYQNHGSEM